MNQTSGEPLTINDFKALLKKHSLKATPQRLAVHEAMLALGHACADQVNGWISSAGKVSFSAASVYNILSQMSELGIYSHRLSSNNKMYFDVNTYSHIHLYDSVNNEYKDVFDEELMDLIESRIKSKRPWVQSGRNRHTDIMPPVRKKKVSRNEKSIAPCSRHYICNDLMSGRGCSYRPRL